MVRQNASGGYLNNPAFRARPRANEAVVGQIVVARVQVHIVCRSGGQPPLLTPAFSELLLEHLGGANPWGAARARTA
eukprot:5548508-Pyramimonas_sp.AAC.1